MTEIGGQNSRGLPRERERELGRRIRSGDRAARDELIVANLALCRHAARRYVGLGLDRDDLESEGRIGLITAAEAWDPGRGTRFSTLAVKYIRFAIIRAITDRGSLIRVPAPVKNLARRRSRAASRGEAIPVTPGQQACLDAAYRARVLTIRGVPNPGRPTADWAPDRFLIEDDRADVWAHFDRLDDRSRAILTLCLGLDGEPMTTCAVGRRMGLYKERVQTLRDRALRELRAGCEGATA